MSGDLICHRGAGICWEFDGEDVLREDEDTFVFDAAAPTERGLTAPEVEAEVGLLLPAVQTAPGPTPPPPPPSDGADDDVDPVLLVVTNEDLWGQ